MATATVVLKVYMVWPRRRTRKRRSCDGKVVEFPRRLSEPRSAA